MDYAKFAIILWIIASVTIAIVGKKSVFRQFGIPQNKIVTLIWFGYLLCVAILGGAISIGITFLMKSI